MIKTALIYSSIYKDHLTPRGHEESPDRLTFVLDYIKRKGLMESEKIKLLKPRKASLREVTSIHEINYVKYIKNLCGSGFKRIDEDTFVSSKSFDVALYAIGGVLKACETVLKRDAKNAFALVRPPGHHAGVKGRAMGASSQGFCIFNNIAAAARFLERRGFKRILIFDFDCHHGNGTQEIFEESPNVLYISIHQDPSTIYPGTGFAEQIGSKAGAGFKVNVPLPPLSGDDAYRMAMNEIFDPIVSEFRPEFILVSAGYDAHVNDPLTNMRASLHTFKTLVERTVEASRRYCGGRLVFTLEGGYGVGLPKGVYTTLMELVGEKFEVGEEETRSREAVLRKVVETIGRERGILKEFWKLG